MKSQALRLFKELNVLRIRARPTAFYEVDTYFVKLPGNV
jgi:hypothetical protein